ncbi:hypothetical protein OG204_11305 [Streptomyces sp. NBC_01387]|uniref:hypothetical protein n=1 Tax=unclassified Streptomyces TaxID=2593676 RepID=UPI002023D26A|nr:MULTISPECIES: hypothetical protein [unclassified Streptomyces]MCX4551164.1 hypothetical protein [Streptomyces sp. NBC_01500]WSC22564.1 hypothetical protein OIE60_24420 [Streptomyces sp. NBC_01766]WSV56407.1 hypothetical protein OG282_23490 [Streptomyces sp. NBC_01014]
MGASRLVRYRSLLAAIGATAAAVAGIAACDPVDGVNTASIAYTTDRTGTSALEGHGVRVDWLTCTADVGDGKSPTPSASVRDVARVDCQGRTKDRKDITIKGKVTKTVDGRCVRGDLTSTVGGQLAFRATLLGNCAAAPPGNNNGGSNNGNNSGGSNSGGTSDNSGGVRPTVTVTVTATVTQYPGK